MQLLIGPGVHLEIGDIATAQLAAAYPEALGRPEVHLARQTDHLTVLARFAEGLEYY